jgi:hypothetical protein
VRTLQVLVALLLGVAVAEAAGILAAVDGASIPEAVVGGAVAFAATVTLALLILEALRG